jgi:hypothetical protein
MKKGFLLASLALLLLSCGNTSQTTDTHATNDGKLHIYYFHTAKRCPTCLAIEQMTEQVLQTHYVQHLGDKIVYQTVNLTDPQNAALANTYQVAWSSLILHRDTLRIDLTQEAFAYARTEPERFQQLLNEHMQQLIP